ncbi:MAG: T9SS type A sorting domain-containing protein [Candidatus Marinimicrobia bacterium]|nr:T9SS type A sorting domain-containing protein [Candidatus Neomarinimicrobiota bacterium]
MLKKTLILTLTICAAASLSISQPAYAQISEFKLTASDNAAGDKFGFSISISGDYAVVGAEGNDDNGDFSGSAYVFKRTGTSWAQEAKLLAADGAEFDNFGFSVSISGDYAVVGAKSDDDNGLSSGSAYVFKRSGTIWAEEAKLLPAEGAAGDRFGFSVSISGDYAVVGAPFDDDNGTDAGSAYLFKRTGTSWTQEAKLLASDGAVEDSFGSSVSISGDYAVVGARCDDDNGTDSGSAYLFKRTGTSWTQEAKLLPSDGAAGDHFGWGGSVSISGDYAVVGAWGDDDNGDASGSVYVYTGFSSPVGVESEIAGLPAEFSLSQNYPNPFNPETVIEFALPQSGDVSLVVYNIRGEEVARLLSGTVPAGNHRVSWHASNIASGIYLYKLQAGGFAQTRKMLLLK